LKLKPDGTGSTDRQGGRRKKEKGAPAPVGMAESARGTIRRDQMTKCPGEAENRKAMPFFCCYTRNKGKGGPLFREKKKRACSGLKGKVRGGKPQTPPPDRSPSLEKKKEKGEGGSTLAEPSRKTYTGAPYHVNKETGGAGLWELPSINKGAGRPVGRSRQQGGGRGEGLRVDGGRNLSKKA